MIPFAAAILGRHPLRSVRILLRDASNHPSPNSGLTEAAMAGALGIRLGGTNTYFGQPSQRPYLGDPLKPIEKKDIPAVNDLMYATVFLFLLLGIGTLHLLS
jgi:adenosylcobinamide-phosphate synthase